MANFTITVTNAGLALLTNAVAGSTLAFTGIAMGSGAYSGSLSAATALVAPKHTLPISALIKGTGQVTAKSVLTYNTIAAGFTWTEIGLYAKDPDGGADILYAYGYAGDKGDYIPSKDEATLTEKVIRVTVMIGNAANVTAQIDGSTVYASAKDLEALEQSVNASITNITQVIQQVTGTDISGGGEIKIDGSMVVTLTHAKTGTLHAFSGLGDRTGLVPCQFKSTGGYTEGDTATVDGTAYTITLTGADAPETDLFVSGKSILVDVDTEGKTINFKAGGGLTKGKLALATATEDTVFNGRTFYAGSKNIRTGTALATPTTVDTSKMFTGVTAYNQQGQLVTGAPTATTATAADIVSGKTAYNSSGGLMTGTMEDPKGLFTSGTATLTASSGSSGKNLSMSFSVGIDATSIFLFRPNSGSGCKLHGIFLDKISGYGVYFFNNTSNQYTGNQLVVGTSGSYEGYTHTSSGNISMQLKGGTFTLNGKNATDLYADNGTYNDIKWYAYKVIT